MNRIDKINALIEQNDAKGIMKLIGSAQAKYLLTDDGKKAKKTSNDNYRAKINLKQATSPDVEAHLLTMLSEEPQTLTELWNNYREEYKVDNKRNLTRSRYKSMLDELKTPIQNPHTRNGIKYYGPAYIINAQ
jgi:transketolase